MRHGNSYTLWSLANCYYSYKHWAVVFWTSVWPLPCFCVYPFRLPSGFSVYWFLTWPSGCSSNLSFDSLYIDLTLVWLLLPSFRLWTLFLINLQHMDLTTSSLSPVHNVLIYWFGITSMEMIKWIFAKEWQKWQRTWRWCLINDEIIILITVLEHFVCQSFSLFVSFVFSLISAHRPCLIHFLQVNRFRVESLSQCSRIAQVFCQG